MNPGIKLMTEGMLSKDWNFKIKLNKNSRAEKQTISQKKNALEITGSRTELVSVKMETHDTNGEKEEKWDI